GVLGARTHRLFAQDMQPALQGEARVLEVQRVRRADDDGVEVREVDQFLGAFGGETKAESFLHLLQFIATETAHSDQFDVVVERKQRHVVGGRPPAGAEETEPHFLRCCHLGSSDGFVTYRSPAELRPERLPLPALTRPGSPESDTPFLPPEEYS